MTQRPTPRKSLISKLIRSAALLFATAQLCSAQTVVTLSPATGSEASAGNLALQITFDKAVIAGSGTLDVIDSEDFTTVVASFAINDPNDVTISGDTVTFSTFPAVGGKSYGINAPAGLVLAADDSAPGPSFSINGDAEVFWFFGVVAADSAGPAISSLSPQNGPGASVSSVLTITYDEDVTLSTGPWTIEIYDITADQVLESFSENDTGLITTLGQQLSISLSGDLAFQNEYRVTCSAGLVMDAVGNLSGEIASGDWQFTTGDTFQPGQVVISQVYGGGGNSGATLRNDYVELYNNSDSAISLAGWSIQYASSSGTSWAVTELTGALTIQPGGYFLVQQSAGNGGTQSLPTPDFTGNTAMGASGGKVALLNSISPIIGADPTGGTNPALSDFVGYGNATAFEGSGSTPTLSATTAAIRLIAGSQDTNDNSVDFRTGSPSPRNTSSPTFVPGTDGSGIAIASNATPGAGSLVGTPIFPSAGSNQSLQIDFSSSFSGPGVTDIEILVPTDFGTPLEGDLILSGTAAGSGTATASGQTISITGVSITEGSSLSVAIAGLSTPDISIDTNDDGKRSFTILTAGSGGTLTEVVSSPEVRAAITLTDLATLRAIGPGGPKAYILANEAIVTYVALGNFRNQHWIQDATAGILIDDQGIALETSYLAGDGLTNLVGEVSEFRGMLQFNPIAVTAAVTSSGNSPAPIELTLAELTAAPLTYQARLVKVTGVTFGPAIADFASNSEHVLTQGSDSFGFVTFFGEDYAGTAVPTGAVDIVGLVRRVRTNPDEDFLSARTLSDFSTGIGNTPEYADFANQFAGGQGPNLDFDGDGVPNGLEYLFGVDSTGFTATPQIIDGSITWPRDPSRTDAGFIVETSDDLANWDPVIIGDLDLTDPNAITFAVPAGAGPFFIRIGATFAP